MLPFSGSFSIPRGSDRLCFLRRFRCASSQKKIPDSEQQVCQLIGFQHEKGNYPSDSWKTEISRSRDAFCGTSFSHVLLRAHSCMHHGRRDRVHRRLQSFKRILCHPRPHTSSAFCDVILVDVICGRNDAARLCCRFTGLRSRLALRALVEARRLPSFGRAEASVAFLFFLLFGSCFFG